MPRPFGLNKPLPNAAKIIPKIVYTPDSRSHPSSDSQAFQAFLDKLGYHYWDESENPAYKLFLE